MLGFFVAKTDVLKLSRETAEALSMVGCPFEQATKAKKLKKTRVLTIYFSV
jgi:hypothetical protein